MLEKVYSCNLCHEKVRDQNLMGVRFKNNYEFVLDEARTTDGTHICMRCLDQLKQQLATKTTA